MIAGCLTVALGVTGMVWQPPAAEAVVVCQRKNKVRLRANTCKKKETQVFDTGEVGVERGRIDGHDTRLDDQDRRVGDLETTLDQRCKGDPQRRLSAAVLIGNPGATGCRAFDGDQAGCEQAFEYSGELGPSSCTYLGDNCIGCNVSYSIFGFCENTCQQIDCVDPARIAPVSSCSTPATQPACEQAWTLTGNFPLPDQRVQATTCYWDAIMLNCRTCGPNQISEGKCQNSCLTPEQFPHCDAEGRTYGDCSTLDGNESACNATYETTEEGPQTCWYEAGQCEPCRPGDEFQGKCSNLC